MFPLSPSLRFGFWTLLVCVLSSGPVHTLALTGASSYCNWTSSRGWTVTHASRLGASLFTCQWNARAGASLTSPGPCGPAVPHVTVVLRLQTRAAADRDVPVGDTRSLGPHWQSLASQQLTVRTAAAPVCQTRTATAVTRSPAPYSVPTSTQRARRHTGLPVGGAPSRCQ
jgi:hypothetical protein